MIVAVADRSLATDYTDHIPIDRVIRGFEFRVTGKFVCYERRY